MSTILLTGGAGFIGSHIAETYTQKGWRVAIVDDFSSGTMENLAAIKTRPMSRFIMRIFAIAKPCARYSPKCVPM